MLSRYIDFEFGIKLLDAVATFGFPVTDLTPEAIMDARRMLPMGVEPIQIRVMSAISGVSFDDAWRDRVVATVGGRAVPFLGRDTLIRNTRAAGRPKDLADIDALTGGSTE